ncbi:Coiled-coil domain-containing protein 55 [Pleurostoma richardsiae]|uniref:Coiled-coil domain-containing protein 55 n=1 Tax=Pleurostoma richardsiae TaxID=41990 RepID=A0AA38RD06_9PEZI|nr:Coiled-coil domain-containing protein 55 [Pleurostoma richardsiae]
MSKPSLSYGLNITKKSGPPKPAPPKRKPVFGDDGSDDEDQKGGEEVISELDAFASPTAASASGKKILGKSRNGAPPGPPSLKSKMPPMTEFGDLSSALSSRKYAKQAEELDPSVYDYDAVYDSFKPQKRAEEAGKGAERKSRYMSDVVKAAEVRERDRSIAELKKIQREREAEGEEFADKEKFVTEAYRRKQEEDRRHEEEERRREEQERKGNKMGGMTGFHKQVLEREEQRHRELMRAAEEAAKSGGKKKEEGEEAGEKEKTEEDIAREINEKGGAVVINDEGQVVDKRQLLRGGLNVAAKKKAEVDREKEASRQTGGPRHADQGKGVFAGGGKNAMRDRQTRMMEAQLEQALKRTREEEEEERKKIEQEAKSRKTQSDISSAKERYLARKRAAEEAKKKGLEP